MFVSQKVHAVLTISLFVLDAETNYLSQGPTIY